jgi:hypothetical protein
VVAPSPPTEPRKPRSPLWFLADREAFLQRFVLRTLLRPPRFRRGPVPRAFQR